MVEIAPFKGVTYQIDKLNEEGANLISPPYDVLTLKDRLDYYKRNKFNILNIDLGPILDSDENEYSWHKRSQILLKEWLEKGVLVKRDKPAIFQVETSFINPENNEKISRKGIICLLKLENFTKNSTVKPHEKTFSNHKKERLSLMKHTNANLSQVFGFFKDKNSEIIDLMDNYTKIKPDVTFKSYDGLTHNLWINEDKEFIKQLKEKLYSETVYIADGHHRYETALKYRDSFTEQLSCESEANYIMVYLSSMSDPGLVILPTHRILSNLPCEPTYLLDKLKNYFLIEKYEFNENNEDIIKNKFLNALKSSKNTSFGLYFKNVANYYLLSIKDESKKELINTSEDSEALSSLDTYILTDLIFKKVIGFGEKEMDDTNLISYISDTFKAIEEVNNGEGQAVFLLNPTKVEDILKVSQSAEIMPRKSTYFYPKVTTGLVMNIINHNEDVK